MSKNEPRLGQKERRPVAEDVHDVERLRAAVQGTLVRVAALEAQVAKLAITMRSIWRSR